ncbi:MAG TPA: hypothetical protein VMG34_03310 [Bacteroidota bacterium]|nr:hypothetical protein [Bacteroidota bacterium]
MSSTPPLNGQRVGYPRSLTSFESKLLLWVLPPDRPGYNSYRKYILEWPVVAEGRRGTGNFILAPEGAVPDLESPLPQVFAYGVVEGENGTISVTIREFFEEQLEFEVVSLAGEISPEKVEEKRRWSFSHWSPSDPCPSCGSQPREVRIQREAGGYALLALCGMDKRLWIFDERDGVNHLIPVTNFHNALMLQKGIRDPGVALAADNLFKLLPSYSDADLTAAFVQYNKVRRKLDLGSIVRTLPRPRSIVRSIVTLFRK